MGEHLELASDLSDSFDRVFSESKESHRVAVSVRCSKVISFPLDFRGEKGATSSGITSSECGEELWTSSRKAWSTCVALKSTYVDYRDYVPSP